MSSGHTDVVIVGGGPAGLNAALVLGRARRRVTVIDAGAPRNAAAAHMQGFLSRDGMPPAGLLELGREEIQRYGVELIEDRVAAIEHGFTVRLTGGRVLGARRLLLATGARDQLPDIPGVQERWGRDLLHCPYCHGWEVRDQALGVLGTAPDAAEHALLVRQWSDDVVFFSHTSSPTPDQISRLTARGVTVIPAAVRELVVEADRLTGVRMADGTVIERQALFIRPVNRPADGGLAETLGCALDAHGFPVVDPVGRTSLPGVWAAGNAADPRLQVIASAGAGAMAAIAINADLVQEETSVPAR
jgi:thioredoxin reductase